MENLALQVRSIDSIKVDDADLANPGGGEIEKKRGPQTAGADAEHFRGLEAWLPFDSDVGNGEMSGIALPFLVR